MKASLGALQQAVGQLRTTVVALELRPPLGDAAHHGADCLQVWAPGGAGMSRWGMRGKPTAAAGSWGGTCPQHDAACARPRAFCSRAVPCPHVAGLCPHALTAVGLIRDSPQWLERAREALKREVADIQQQHGQLAAGLASAVAAAAAAPASPQKALAAQVLTGLQGSMQHEVGRELQALQLADRLLGSVAQQHRGSPPRSAAAVGGNTAAAAAAVAAQAEPKAAPAAEEAGGEAAAGVAVDAATCKVAFHDTPVTGGGDAAGEWAIAAVSAGSGQPDYPAAPSSQQAVAAAAGSALSQLNQLAGSRAGLAHAAAHAAGGHSTSGGGSLRQTFGQMQHMLHSVCQLLQQDDDGRQRGGQPGEWGCQRG